MPGRGDDGDSCVCIFPVCNTDSKIAGGYAGFKEQLATNLSRWWKSLPAISSLTKLSAKINAAAESVNCALSDPRTRQPVPSSAYLDATARTLSSATPANNACPFPTWS